MVSVLVPSLSKPPVPLITPLYVVLLPLAPTSSRPLPSHTWPLPASEPMAVLLLVRLNTPDPTTRTAVWVGSMLAPRSISMPLLTMVSPTCALTRASMVVPLPSRIRSITLVPMLLLVMMMVPAPPK